jgi:hypothetical protein
MRIGLEGHGNEIRISPSHPRPATTPTGRPPHLFRQRQPGAHQHRRPVDRVEPQNIFPDDVDVRGPPDILEAVEDGARGGGGERQEARQVAWRLSVGVESVGWLGFRHEASFTYSNQTAAKLQPDKPQPAICRPTSQPPKQPLSDPPLRASNQT